MISFTGTALGVSTLTTLSFINTFNQFDMVLSKHIPLGGRTNFEFRMEFFNLLNTNNFANPSGKLAQAIPNDNLAEADRVQPGFGAIRSTVGRTVGLGTNRQVQLGFRLNF